MNANKSDNLGDAKPETPAQAEKPVTAPRFRARAQRVPGETTGSLCRISAQHLGLLGTEVAPGRYQLRCPWAHQHAPHCKQRDGILDNSTILYMPGAELSDAERAAQGDDVPLDGGLFCMHEHSAGSQRGVPLNASVFLSYARSCGAPLPDRPRYMVDGKDEGDYAPLLGADLPPQERCDIDPNEASFTFDAEGVINTGELSGKDLHELGLFQPGEARLCTSAKDPASMEDAGNTFDELTSRVSAQLNMPKDAIVSSAAALAKSQGFRIPEAPLSPPGKRLSFAVPAVDWLSAFLSECCIVDADASVPTPDLRGVFEIWYKSNHEGSPPLAQFWKMLAEKGYESDRGSTGSFRVRRGLRLAEQSRAYQAFLQSESASDSADTREGGAPAKSLAVLHVAASSETVMLNGLALPLIQIRTNGDEVEITYQATHKDVPGGACYADVVACLQSNPVPVKHHALNAVGITMLRVTKLDLPKQVSKGVAHATLTGINASTKIAATFAEYVGERPTTPFKKFLADCLTPEQADRLQLIFGRMRSSDPRLTDKCYVHVGDGANGKTTLLSAVVKLFKGVRLSGAVESDAKVLLQLEPAVAMLECADAVSPVWIKTMATSGTQVHITSNRELSALDTDQSILRRVEVIRWEKTIPADQRNPDMASEIAEDIDFAFWLFKGQERIHAGER